VIKKLKAIYQKMSKREKWILYGTTLVLMGLFLDRLVMQPIIGKLASLDRQIRDEETAIKKSLHILVQKNRILAESKEFASEADVDPFLHAYAAFFGIAFLLLFRRKKTLAYVKTHRTVFFQRLLKK